MAKLTKTGVDKALHEMHGNISAAARALSVTRHALDKYIRENPELQQFIFDARESMADDAETALNEAVLAAEPWAVKYALSCLRGSTYAERTILAGDKDSPLNINHSGKISHAPSIQAEDAAFAETLAAAATAGAEAAISPHAEVDPDAGAEPDSQPDGGIPPHGGP